MSSSNSNPKKKLLPLRKTLKNNHQIKQYSLMNIARKTLYYFLSINPQLIYTKFRTLTNRPWLNSDHRHHSYQKFSVTFFDELFQGINHSAYKTYETIDNRIASSSSSTAKKSLRVIKTIHDIPNLQKHHDYVESATNHEKGLSVSEWKAKFDDISNNPAAADHPKWKIPLLPHFRGIDERADEFIAKFRQDMKLQREQSILDFEEMLKRSV